MESLLRILPAFVRQLDESPEARERAAFVAWDAVAGESVARVTTPEHLAGRRLVVQTSDAMWKRQLDRLAPQYIFSINSLLGAPVVTQIVFRIDPTAVARAHPEPPALLRRSDVEARAAELASDAEVIADPVLKRAFLRAAGTCLARNERRPAKD
jgi:hypothetical protein